MLFKIEKKKIKLCFYKEIKGVVCGKFVQSFGSLSFMIGIFNSSFANLYEFKNQNNAQTSTFKPACTSGMVQSLF